MIEVTRNGSVPSRMLNDLEKAPMGSPNQR